MVRMVHSHDKRILLEPMEHFLIDGIGPFFRGYTKRQVNWSKIPFHHLPKDPAKCREQFEQIRSDLTTFATKVSALGYNGITLDDVAHLAKDPWLEPEINRRIEMYQKEFDTLFDLCTCHGLNIFLTMDVLSLTPMLKQKIGGNHRLAVALLKRQVETVLDRFPQIKGLILRIGECDGKDVKGVFKSELILKTPRQVNRMLHDLLPIFEARDKLLILRTWTVGAFKVGDLIWHRGTLTRVLKKINSPNFILSLKYGESDFFRYLPLNSHFFRHKVQKIIELQARREYEGCGEYPSFIGWDYHAYGRQLEDAENIVGMSVWCQTGGWVPFRRLTFLDKEGIWNELNSFVCIRIFKQRQSVEETITDFATSLGCTDGQKFITFLQLNDQVIKELLYIEDLADQKLFFRRVRIPPLLTVFWNNVFINHSVRKILLTLVHSGEESVQQGYRALKKIKEMEKIAEELDLPVEDIRYMYDTFALLALARKYYFLPYNEDLRKKLRKAKRKYKKRYPRKIRPRYRIKTNFSHFTLRRRHLQWLLNISLRKKRGYRLIDYLLTLHLLGVVYRLVVMVRPMLIPKFARKQAMGIETIFK